jgi:hypothetical protein
MIQLVLLDLILVVHDIILNVCTVDAAPGRRSL